MESIETKEEEGEKERLSGMKNFAYRHMKITHKNIEGCKGRLAEYKEIYDGWRDIYEKADRELADLDGRFQKIPNKKSAVKSVKDPLAKLSKGQILDVVKVLETKLKKGGDIR